MRNAKFTSPTTLLFIHLMQRSLVEIGRIDISLTYRYMFVYIRQLAIHLRNAITVKKKVKTVKSAMVVMLSQHHTQYVALPSIGCMYSAYKVTNICHLGQYSCSFHLLFFAHGRPFLIVLILLLSSKFVHVTSTSTFRLKYTYLAVLMNS